MFWSKHFLTHPEYFFSILSKCRIWQLRAIKGFRENKLFQNCSGSLNKKALGNSGPQLRRKWDKKVEVGDRVTNPIFGSFPDWLSIYLQFVRAFNDFYGIASVNVFDTSSYSCYIFSNCILLTKRAENFIWKFQDVPSCSAMLATKINLCAATKNEQICWF